MFDIIGEFDVQSGKLRISDPCYDADTWCAGEVEAVNGRWVASVARSDEGGWGERIARLMATHVDCPVPAGNGWRLLSIDVGVDSGQAGVFDAAHYRDDSLAQQHPVAEPLVPEEPWYSLCCDRTLGSQGAGVIPFGAVASSGYGDGSYQAFGLHDAEERLMGVMIVFIGEDEDEAEAEWDDEEDDGL
jgi:hypothetical protein